MACQSLRLPVSDCSCLSDWTLDAISDHHDDVIVTVSELDLERRRLPMYVHTVEVMEHVSRYYSSGRAELEVQCAADQIPDGPPSMPVSMVRVLEAIGNQCVILVELCMCAFDKTFDKPSNINDKYSSKYYTSAFAHATSSQTSHRAQ